MLKDMKEALSSVRKPDITHVRSNFLAYVSRPAELGEVKYVRGNYLRPTGDGPHTTPTAEDFKRLRSYARAAASHIMQAVDAMEHHLARDPELQDVEGMRRAAYAIDTDVPPNSPHPPSLLPHIAPACTSLMMAIEQAVACGLLPADPGQPWRNLERTVMTYADGAEVVVWQEAPVLTGCMAKPKLSAEGQATFDRMMAKYMGGEQVLEPAPRREAYTPRIAGCTSNECEIRNKCTGSAQCPRGMAPAVADEERMRRADQETQARAAENERERDRRARDAETVANWRAQAAAAKDVKV